MAGLRNARRNKLVCKLKLVDKSRCDEGYTVLEKEEFNPESGDTYGDEKSLCEQFTKKPDAEIKVKIKTKKNRSEKTKGNDADESFERNCKKRHFENFADNILSGLKALVIIIVIIALAGAGHHIAKWRIAEKNKTVEPYKYVLLNNGTYMIDTNVTRLSGDLVIPSSYNGSPVTAIADRAFYGHTITSVTIPDSVTSIGTESFSCCDSLTSITLGKDLKSIGNGAFYKCRRLKAISIPSSVTSIGERAFSGCMGLSSSTIPDSVMSIGDYAFSDCMELTSVTIGKGVISIGEKAFNNCIKLIEVYNKSSLSITAESSSNGRVAYYAKNVYTREEGSKLSTDENGYIIYSDGDEKVLVSYTGTKTTLTLPSSITQIYTYALYGLNRITSIMLPDGVTSIGDFAFSDCTGLMSITLGKGLKIIGNSAFYRCSGLQIVIIPNSVNIIGKSAFQNCTSLNNVTIPDNSVMSIGKSAFDSCTSLPSITIPNSVMLIGEYAFANCSKLKRVTINNGEIRIGDGAFPVDRKAKKGSSIIVFNGTTQQWGTAYSSELYKNWRVQCTNGTVHVD